MLQTTQRWLEPPEVPGGCFMFSRRSRREYKSACSQLNSVSLYCWIITQDSILGRSHYRTLADVAFCYSWGLARRGELSLSQEHPASDAVPVWMHAGLLSVKGQPALHLENVHCDLHVSPGVSWGESVPLRGKARSLGSTIGGSHERQVEFFAFLRMLIGMQYFWEVAQGLGGPKEGLSREGRISLTFQAVPNDVERIPTLRAIDILIGTCKPH